MPRATARLDGERVDLKSCPPDGFVVIRQLSFGEMLERRDQAVKYYQESSTSRRQVQDIVKTEIDVLNKASRRYDFTTCIVDHNLEDDHGNKLNFQNPSTLDVLDPLIAMEIERAIDKLNREDVDEEDFTTPSGEQSSRTSEASAPDEVFS